MATQGREYLKSFPAVQELARLAGPDIIDVLRLIKVRPGASLYELGQPCENYLLILSGSVRVQKLSEKGQVITLYHLAAGRACELTTTCLLGGKKYPAEAVAETDVEAVLIPKSEFQRALAVNAPFREAIFTSIDKGVNELIGLLEEVSFGRMDSRLARLVLQGVASGNSLEITHQALAEELGTAREVVSRLLKGFEQHGWVRLHRGRIEIVDRSRLQALAK